MLIYIFYVRLLIKKLPSFSIGQLNIITIVYIHILPFLCHSQGYTFQQGTPKAILKSPISLV